MEETTAPPAPRNPDPETLARHREGEEARRAYREGQKKRIASAMAAADARGATSKACGD